MKLLRELKEILVGDLVKLFLDKTIITITHRLTTLKNTDRILVFYKRKQYKKECLEIYPNNMVYLRTFLSKTIRL